MDGTTQKRLLEESVPTQQKHAEVGAALVEDLVKRRKVTESREYRKNCTRLNNEKKDFISLKKEMEFHPNGIIEKQVILKDLLSDENYKLI